MNRERILAEANQVFSGLTNIGENLYKGELKMEDKSAGIYFIDLNGELNVHEFKDYQENILSEEYYKQEEELQWNLYLLFVADKFNTTEKETIESNQKYARKYVFTEEEFIDYFKLDQKAGPVQSDIVVQWKQELDGADLQEVYSDETYADAVPRFLTDSTVKISAGSYAAGSSDVKDFQFINRLSLTDQYRKSPEVRDFKFGRVNLFKGVNGSGKTSILEAIELVICGRNLRNEDSILPDHCISAVINGNIQETCTPSNNTKYRLRDQKWYSNVYGRGNSIFNSFSRFNFFDSDAASNFSKSNSERQLKEALQNLVLGEEFKYIKDRVSGFLGRLGPELNRLKRQIEEASQKNTNADAIIMRENKEGAATLILGEVNKNLRDLKLKTSLEVSAKELGKVDIVINEIKALLDRISSTKLIYGKNLKSLNEVKGTVENKLKVLSDYKEEDDKSGSEISILEKRLIELTNKVELLHQAVKILENPRLLELEGLKYKIDASIKELKNIEIIETSLIPIAYQSFKKLDLLKDLIENNNEQVLLIRRELGEISLEISNRMELLGNIEGLVKQIRDKGKELIHLKPEIENCPLCDTLFKPNELKKKLDDLIMELNGDASQENSKDVSERKIAKEGKLKELEKNLKAYRLLNTVYYEIFNKDSMIHPLKDIIEELENYYSKKFTIESTKEQLDSLKKLGEEIGVSEQNLQEIKSSLSPVDGKKYVLAVTELDTIREDYQNAEGQKKKLAGEIENKKKHRYEAYQNLVLKLDVSKETKLKIEEIQAFFLKDKAEILSLIENYNKLAGLISFSQEELAEDINQKLSAVEKNIASLRKAIETDSELNRAKKDKSEAETFLKDNKKKNNRLQMAVDILEKLNANAGTSEMSVFFDTNVKQIVEVFRLIHSPREFINLIYSNGIVKLIDKEGIERSITEISTGQRAALALSIFISMNRMLKSGPNIILFDDPVSHIDDLNALSFLDFLRIFMLREKKQIFFASANARLSRLFERKFEFLGDTDFKKWDLMVSQPASTA
jgi:exonuclease SbcC